MMILCNDTLLQVLTNTLMDSAAVSLPVKHLLALVQHASRVYEQSEQLSVFVEHLEECHTGCRDVRILIILDCEEHSLVYG